jgi:uncharacterized protein YndB with AHSA1/START domain
MRTETSKPEFVYVTYIETTPEKLWHALTDREFSSRYWFGYGVNSTWTIGAPFELGQNGAVANSGTILESDPPRRLAYTWETQHDAEMKKERPSRVTFEIEQLAGAVKLTVTHEDFAQGSKVLPSISGGWPMVLANLKSVLETGRVMDLHGCTHEDGAQAAE